MPLPSHGCLLVLEEKTFVPPDKAALRAAERQKKERPVYGRKKLIIEEAWCKGCGICAAFCPKHVLEIRDEKVRITDPGKCISCGLCELRCPDYAIYLVNMEE